MIVVRAGKAKGGRKMLTGLVFLAALFLAYANGANDNFKGVATLYGSFTANYRTALWLGTIADLRGIDELTSDRH
jgi:phosphate/sulfate permease